MKAMISGADVLAARRTAAVGVDDAPPLPDYVLQTLARLRLLMGVPFSYLVPDPGLLPPESARFFHLDPAWLDELCAGALAVGAGGTREQAQAELARALAPDQVGRHLPLVRDLQRGRGVLETALEDATHTLDPEADITGVLIRSQLVSGWPALQVRAYTTAAIPPNADPATLDPSLSVPILRMEILEASIMLVLFAGVPRLVWLEEPHHGIQLGVEATSTAGFEVHVRHDDGTEGAAVGVPLRDAALGVVDVAGLRGALDAAAGLSAPRGSAALALALTRAPARQRFGGAA